MALAQALFHVVANSCESRAKIIVGINGQTLEHIPFPNKLTEYVSFYSISQYVSFLYVSALEVG